MHRNRQPAIAIIADAHCHDIDSDYGVRYPLSATRMATLRSWHDTRRAPRVFNESLPALRWALADIRRRGIRHVVMPGDYTDDGQLEATQRLRQLLQAEQENGLHFLLIPGNHDAFGPCGKHQSTRFARHDGETVLVSSDPKLMALESDAVHSPGMYRQSSRDAVTAMAQFGLFRQSQHHHWETPFGNDDKLSARCHTALSADGSVQHELLDASYLVEPLEGLWLLMIDANVFEPRDGNWRVQQKQAFIDCSDIGWNRLIDQRPHLLPWIRDVCRRARAENKHLLTFSHYPIMDPLDDHSDSEGRLFGKSSLRRRRPQPAIARALLQAGLDLHFGGHLHVNACRRLRLGERELVDIAIPSTAAFPAAYLIARPGSSAVAVETVPLDDMPLDSDLLAYYRRQAGSDLAGREPTLQSENYGQFQYRRMYSRVRDHFLAREWPEALGKAMQHSNAERLALFLLAQQDSEEALFLDSVDPEHCKAASPRLQALCRAHGMHREQLADCPSFEIVVNWYCLRQAGHQACNFMSPTHHPVLDFLAQHFGRLDDGPATTQAAFLQIFLGQLGQLLAEAIPGRGLRFSIERG